MLLFIAFDQKVRTSADWIYLVYSYGMSKKYRTRSWLITVNRRLRSSKAIVLKRSSTLIFARHRSLSKYLNIAFRTDSLYVSRCAKTNMVRREEIYFTYPGFLFSPSVLRLTSVWEKPYWRSSMHFWIAFLISNMCIEVLFEVQAMMCRVGWKMIFYIIALPEPRLNVCRVSPPSALNILITVPRWEADAISVPSGFTLRAPSSVSCA